MPSPLSDARTDLNLYTGGRTFICYDPAPSPARLSSMKAGLMKRVLMNPFVMESAPVSRRREVSRALRSQGGFTLIEIMVVVVIIGLLAAVIVPSVVGQVDKARVTKAKADVSALESALTLYRLDNSKYPTTEQGLAALTTQPTDPSIRNWRPGGYLTKKVPKDPWGNDYLYV